MAKPATGYLPQPSQSPGRCTQFNMDKDLKLPENLYQYLIHLYDTSTTRDVQEFLIHSEIFRERTYHSGFDEAYKFYIIVDPEVYKKYQNRIRLFEDEIRAKFYQFSHQFVSNVDTFPNLHKFQILKTPIAPIKTPWEEINSGQNHLLGLQRSANTSLDYQNIGNTCRTLLQKLADVVFDPLKHTADDKNIDLGVSKFKNRLHTYIKVELAGSNNKELRDYALSVITTAEKSADLANKLTHDLKADSLMSESCIISTITVISIVKLIAR